MQSIRLISSALGVLLAASPTVYAGEAHVHGHGTLDVAIDGNIVTLRLESPLDSFVGFERAPRNDKERAAVRRMAQWLRAESAFVPSAAARCRRMEVTLSSPVLDPALLAPAAEAAAGGGRAHSATPGSPKGHAEIVGEYVYECAETAALRAVEVRLFESFKGLKRLDAQVAAPQGQSGARLTAKSRTLVW
jgi:hypothetical protein